MSNLDQVYQLVEWLKGFKAQWLQNEDDVETKFIIPLFQKLGYANEFFQGKYPNNSYNPRKQGRKPESDRVYFSVSESKLQDRKTSLIIIEAKKPTDANLGEAIKQAEYYETNLKPIFLVVTNGRNLIVIKPHRCTESELVFDLTVEELSSEIEKANKFYNQLNFESVKRNKEEYQNVLPHERYTLLERSLRKYPDLQNILDQDEFEPEIKIDGSRLKIVKPNISLECELPILLKKIYCEIKFHHILRRGLKIRINQRDILGKFMMGSGNSPDRRTRSFVKKVSEDDFEVILGELSTTLSRMEIEDLCLCIDEMCQKYKASILEIETSLEAEKYKPVEIPTYSTFGFHLLSVQQWFWDLMKKFSEEQIQTNDESEWDIFGFNSRAIRIEKGGYISALLYPVHPDTISSNNLLGGYVDVIYDISNIPSSLLDSTPWQQSIGSRGIWTVNYTKVWLLEKLIPKIKDYYPEKFDEYYWQFSENHERGWYHPYMDDKTCFKRRIPLEKVSELKHLAPYLHDIQSWIFACSCSGLDVSTLYPCHRSFIELCKQADFSTAHINYLIEQLSVFELHEAGQKTVYDLAHNFDKDYILEALNQYLERVSKAQYESSVNADSILRLFIAVVEECEIHYSQSQLNAAKQALIPLWQQSQFEMRYVFPNC